MKKINGAYVADTARVLGEVELKAGASIWYGVSMRGDVAKIVIGENTNVQDNATVHCVHGVPNIIGDNTTIGHNAVCHGSAIGSDCLIGMGAILLDGSVIGNNCVVAAGCVVPPNFQVPDNSVIMGIPGKIVREINDKEKAFVAKNAPHYVRLAELHATKPDDTLTKPYGS